MPTIKAAPIAPKSIKTGVPTNKLNKSALISLVGKCSKNPSNGLIRMSGKQCVSQWLSILQNTNKVSG